MPTKLKQEKQFFLVIEAFPNEKGTGQKLDSYERFEACLKDYSVCTPCKYWAIQHYADFDENGEIERLHWHLFLEYYTRKTATGVLRDLGEFFFISESRISIRKVNSKISCLRYLLHLDDPHKTLYLPSDVITNHYPDFVEALSRKEQEISIRDISNAIDDSLDRADLIDKIGLKNYSKYRQTINDVIKAKRRFDL